MKILGLRIPFTGESKALSSVPEHGGGGWYPIVREAFPGAWQRNIEINRDTAASFHADFACKTLIARDIAKLRLKLVEEDDNGIWTETTNPAYSPVLRSPNPYQTSNQFWESWMLSKLSRGNTYVLKVRDNRNVVTALYVLRPSLVTPLIGEDESVFYRLNADNLTPVREDDWIVPARDIIHDRFNCLEHQLVGLPPVYASGLASQQGLNIQGSSVRLFANNSSPGGLLTAPGTISETTTRRLKESWEESFSGRNVGRVAILGDGLKYEKMALTAVEGQLIEQLKWTAEVVCSTYHVPPYKIGVVPPPSWNNIQALNVEYYSQCLQSLIEDAESCLDKGLGIGYGVGLGVEFDVENLLRMDSVTQMDVLEKSSGKLSPNEQRQKLGYKPVKGGDSPMVQQQNFSLEALAKRDAQDDPFATKQPAVSALPAPKDDANEEEIEAAKQIAVWKLKSLLAAA